MRDNRLFPKRLKPTTAESIFLIFDRLSWLSSTRFAKSKFPTKLSRKNFPQASLCPFGIIHRWRLRSTQAPTRIPLRIRITKLSSKISFRYKVSHINIFKFERAYSRTQTKNRPTAVFYLGCKGCCGVQINNIFFANIPERLIISKVP